MFGEAKTPTIAQGRVPLVLELLRLRSDRYRLRDLPALSGRGVSRSARDEGRY